MDNYKKGAIERIENRNKSFFELNATINKFFTHLTTVLLLFLGLIVQLRPQENQQNASSQIFLLLVCLIVLSALSSITVLYGEISVGRKSYRIYDRMLREYVENKGQTETKIKTAVRYKVFEYAEIFALVFLVLSLVCLVVYIYLR